MAEAPNARSLIELRLIDGPNLYFPRPAAKVTLDLTELLGLPRQWLVIWARSSAWARRILGRRTSYSGSVTRYGS